MGKGMFSDVKVPAAGGGDYLRLKDGDTFKLRFVGEPVVFLDNYANTRWGNVVWNYTEDKAQAYSYTKTIVNRVKELEEDEDWGDVRTYDVKVSRKGSTKEDTEYSLTPNPAKAPLTEEQLEACEKLDLFKMFKGSLSISEYNEGGKLEVPEPANPEEGATGYQKARMIAEQLGAKKEDTPPYTDEDAPISLEDIPF